MNALRRLFNGKESSRLRSVAQALEGENERLRGTLAAQSRMNSDLWKLVRALRDVNASLDAEKASGLLADAGRSLEDET